MSTRTWSLSRLPRRMSGWAVTPLGAYSPGRMLTWRTSPSMGARTVSRSMSALAALTSAAALARRASAAWAAKRRLLRSSALIARGSSTFSAIWAGPGGPGGWPRLPHPRLAHREVRKLRPVVDREQGAAGLDALAHLDVNPRDDARAVGPTEIFRELASTMPVPEIRLVNSTCGGSATGSAWMTVSSPASTSTAQRGCRRGRERESCTF